MSEFLICEFTVSGKAASRGSKRPVTNKRTGRTILIDGKNSYKYMANVKTAAIEAMRGQPPYDGPVYLYWVAGFSRPKSHFNSKGLLKPLAPVYYTGTPDLSKAVRGLEDAMSKVVYVDDKQIVGYRPEINKIWVTGEPFTHVKVFGIA